METVGDLTNLNYEQLDYIFKRYFNVDTLGIDFSKRLALISLTNYLVQKFRESKPGVTHYQILYKILKDEIPQNMIESLSILCETMGKNCNEFPTFGISPKDMPKTIKDIVHGWLPF